MAESQMQSSNGKSTPGLPENDAISLLDYLEVVVKRKRMVFRITFVTAILSLIISFIIPKIYSATARILPPQQDQGLMGMMLGQMGGGISSVAGDLLGKGSLADQYVGILNSEAIKDTIIDRFHLMEVYDKDYRVETYKTVDKWVDVTVGKRDGIISITVEDKDPKRAADMANAYVEELGKLTAGLDIAGAKLNKKYLEGRLAKAKSDLVKAEETLKVFQTKNKTVNVTEQVKASIEGVALLKAQLAVQEAQLSALRSQYTDSTQEVQNIKATVRNLTAQINRLEGTGTGAVPYVGSVPDLGQEYIRLMREFKIQETLVDLLTKQYEINNLTAAKDISNVQVIQTARTPDKKSKPKRALIILGATVGMAFIALAMCFVLESFDRMTSADRQRWERLASSLPFPALLKRYFAP